MKLKQTIFTVCICLMAVASAWAQNVYVGGQSENRAVVWTNGTPIYLTEDQGWIHSVSVHNGEVYAAGVEVVEGIYVGKVWKDGSELYALSDGTTNAYISSLAVSNGDVYVAGTVDTTGNYTYAGKLWKNGTPEAGYDNAKGLDFVFIDGSNIYVAGYTTSYDATVWKNGTLLYTLASGADYHYAYSVVVHDGDVYTAGYEYENNKYVPKVWKNESVLYTLTTGTSSTNNISLAVSGDDIYAAGFDVSESGRNVAKIWKNGTGTALTDGTVNSYAMSVFVSDSDVYVAGTENFNKALLWKNGVAIPLSSDSGYAHSVFVTLSSSGEKSFAENNIRLWSAEGMLHINLLKTEAVHIYNIQGALVKTWDNVQGELNTALSKGIYIVRIGDHVTKVVI